MKLLMFECANKTVAEIVDCCKNIKGIETEHGCSGICGIFLEDHKPEVETEYRVSSGAKKRGRRDNHRKSVDSVVVNEHNICLIHKESIPPHTAASCKDIKKRQQEYVEKQKKWSGSSAEWNKERTKTF